MRFFWLAMTLLFSVAGCNSDNRQILAHVLLTQGNAQVVRQGGAVTSLRLADTLGASSRIMTGPGGAAGASLAPGIMMLLDEQTEMTIDQLEMQKSDDNVASRHARVTLRRGLARFSVGAPPDRRIDLEVIAADTGQLYAEPGALFTVAMLGQNQGARVTCAKGTIRCMDKASKSGVWIQAGDFLDLAIPNDAPSQDEVLAETEIRHELAALFVTDTRLEALQKTQRSLTPFQVRSH